MKNDLDFIKDKIKNSGVKAPEDMDESYVAKTLEGVSPQPVAVPPKRRRKAMKIAISATAAGLVLVIALGVILNIVFNSKKTTLVTLPGGLELKQYQSHDEVTKDIAELKQKAQKTPLLQFDYRSSDGYVEDYGVADGDMAAEDGGSSGSSNNSAGGSPGRSAASDQSDSYSETYKQVEGVDEADIIKTDGRYIYYVDNYSGQKGMVIIFSADGENSKKVAEIDVFSDTITATPDEATPDEADQWDYYYYERYVENIYLRDNRLIVIYNDDSGYDGYTPGKAMTKVYDVSDIEHITLLDSYMQSGKSDSSRMIGDTLYLVSSYTPYKGSDLPICGRGEEPDQIPADCIYSLYDNDTAKFLVLSAYDTLDHTAQTQSKSILGNVDDMYCNLEHMYIYATHREHQWYDRFNLFGDDTETELKTTQILKVNLKDGIEFTAYTEVPGVVDDQYAFDEYEGNLRVATTTTEQEDSNHLFVLDEDLSIIGSVNGFARNESIKAVRYVGKTAYVITYEQTDPLFVIDLSDPTDPTILGEAKITGFSTMLVPIDENTILGIGYHTTDGTFSDMEVESGVKLALFDVSDKLNPKVIDSRVYENYTSEVQTNPKALVYNPDRDDYIIPLNYENFGDYDSETGEYVSREEYEGGVLNFKVENNQLVEIGHYKSDCYEVSRCIFIGDTVYMVCRDRNYELQIDSVSYKK